MCSKTMKIPLLRKTSYDFSFLAAFASETIVIAPAIDVASFYRMTLFLRVHNLQMSAGQLVHVEIDHTLPSDEDPAEFIMRNATGAPLASLDIDSSDTPPALISTSATELGAALRVRLTATQGSTAGTPFFVELSGVLVLQSF